MRLESLEISDSSRRPDSVKGIRRRRRSPMHLTLVLMSVLLTLGLQFSYLFLYSSAISITATSQSGQFSLAFQESLLSSSAPVGERPRLIPLVVADSGYSENSSVNILCTVSQGHHESLSFDWFKDGQLISSGPTNSASGNLDNSITTLASYSASLDGESQAHDSGFGGSSGINRMISMKPEIEKNPDRSLLRISRVQVQHSGRYTCSAKNQFGQDSSSVNLRVNGKYAF